ncbi:glycosyltransferase family 2 protein [Salinibacter grassmerensis]|uniref:glycosyltransferase family 2 protein n=1 Tax=Salinibacter grassmerensis TaxID=3040353 RepID=UPI0021E8755C|nr:glycosyltransferase family A protein [Salinibacter grassmerensis]
MTPRPDISIVIPCYNSETFVEATVRSALNQTFSTEEVICVDDGSTDETLEVLRSIQEDDGHLSVHAQENQGICGARNTGLRIANGEYVAFLDHDDVLEANKLEHQAKLIADCSFRPDFVAAAYEEVYPDQERAPKTRPVNTADPWIGLIHARLGRTSSNLWRKTAIQEAGAWQDADGLSLDTGLMFRMLTHDCQMLEDPASLTTRYVRATSASMADRIAQWSTFLDLRAKILRHLRSHNRLTQARAKALHLDMIQAVRGLYEHDPELAARKHENLVRGHFRSSDAAFGPGRLYRALYRTLGFQYAEAMYPLWLRFRQLLLS